MMKTAATLFLLVVVATTVLVAASEHGGAGAALPSFFVYECPRPLNWDVVHDISSRFILSDCSGPARQQTTVKACYDNEMLRLFFINKDDNVESNYRNCNDPLFNQDVVEAFIGPARVDGKPITNYLEIELSPNSVLFASNITNPGLTCSTISGTYLPCSLFNYKATRFDSRKIWWGQIDLPWAVLHKFRTAEQQQHDGFHSVVGAPVGTTWRTNFFRIDRPAATQTREFSCFSCDESSPPCFHKPAYFAYLHVR